MTHHAHPYGPNPQQWGGPAPAPQPPKKKGGGCLKIAGIAVLAVVSVGVLSQCVGASDSATPAPVAPAATQTTVPPTTQAAEPTQPAEQGTVSQRQAVKKAESYLKFGAFSRSGLIDQLKFEGFSTEDATYAVDHIEVDWNVQAEKKAASYLEFSSFSRQGLIDQLEFEGFTPEQAAHGADSVGL